jgi:predicted PurR-regulated permease PerM
MLYFSETIAASIRRIFRKIAGERGDHFADMTVSAVRNVVKGILGVAIIQTMMAALGFFIAGVPYAGLWTVLCLVLAIVQIGIGPIAIPIAIYMFSTANTMTATILAIWLGITLVIDNVLKPILLGHKAPAPMLVIFLGAIGGFIYNGFLGLFLGAVILCIGYQLFIIWLHSDTETAK